MASGRGLGLLPHPMVCGEGRLGPAEGERTNLLCRALAPRAPPAARPGPEWVCVYISSGPSHPPSQCRRNKHRACFPTNRPTIFQRRGEEGENAASLINCNMNSSAAQQL